MKKRRLFSMAAASLVAVSMLAVLPMSVGAAGTNYSTTLATGSTNTTQLKKVLVIEDDANIPAASFTFTAAAGSAVGATENTLAVLAGVGAENITYKLVTGTDIATDFASGKTNIDNTNKKSSVTLDYAAQKKVAGDITDDDYVTITDDDGKDTYSAVKTIQLDFSKCGFTEPGVYRYIITESGTNAGITNDTKDTRTIDVYVEDATTTDEVTGTTTKQLKIKGYVMYVGTLEGENSGPSSSSTGTAGTAFTAEDGTTSITPNGMEVAGATKSVGFQNTYATHDLIFGKKVTGNQGSKDKYFKFTVSIDNLAEGTVLDVDLNNADSAQISANPNDATTVITADYTNPAQLIASGTPSTYTVENGSASETKKITVTYYLQHGQSIKIQGIPDGASYTITEDNEDYDPSTALSETSDKMTGENEGTAITVGDDQNSISDTAIKADTEVTFTNDRNGIIPTGILISIAPIAIVGILVIGGIVFLTVRSKRRNAEEE